MSTGKTQLYAGKPDESDATNNIVLVFSREEFEILVLLAYIGNANIEYNRDSSLQEREWSQKIVDKLEEIGKKVFSAAAVAKSDGKPTDNQQGSPSI